jgi:hypothetical protein
VIKMTDEMTSLPDGLALPPPGSSAALALPSALEYGIISQDWDQNAAQADPIVGPALRAAASELATANAVMTAEGEAEPTGAAATHFLSWHEDSFTLPAGAVPLSSRENCPAQAFKLGPTAAAAAAAGDASGTGGGDSSSSSSSSSAVYGFQFHSACIAHRAELVSISVSLSASLSHYLCPLSPFPSAVSLISCLLSLVFVVLKPNTPLFCSCALAGS